MITLEKAIKEFVEKYEGEVGWDLFNLNIITQASLLLDGMFGMDELKDEVGAILSKAVDDLKEKKLEEISSN